MTPATQPLNFDHLPRQEIKAKHKEAIRQLYSFAKVELLITLYKLRRSTIE
jgi:hypothetical protein